MKTEIKTLNYYDGISKGYKSLYHDEQVLKIHKIKEFLPSNGILLDLGSGDGVLNQFLELKKTKLISFDLSFELLKLNKNTNRIQGSILNLPFKTNSIDNISSFTVFQDLPDVKKGIKEIKRVLKNNGTFILSFLHLAKDVKILLEEISKNFKIIKEIKEEKDYIFILQNDK